MKYAIPSGSISTKYSRVSQVRPSVNMSPIRCSQLRLRSLKRGRRGMRSPSSTSTSRPSSSDSPRMEPKNSTATGTPMIRISRPSDSDRPVTTQLKKKVPVASDSSM